MIARNREKTNKNIKSGLKRRVGGGGGKLQIYHSQWMSRSKLNKCALFLLFVVEIELAFAHWLQCKEMCVRVRHKHIQEQTMKHVLECYSKPLK